MIVVTVILKTNTCLKGRLCSDFNYGDMTQQLIYKSGTGFGSEKNECGEWDVGGEMVAILLAYAAFWLKQHKIPFEPEFCRPLAYDGIVANLPQGSPSSTAIEIPMTAEQQADLCFFATYLHIRLED